MSHLIITNFFEICEIYWKKFNYFLYTVQSMNMMFFCTAKQDHTASYTVSGRCKCLIFSVCRRDVAVKSTGMSSRRLKINHLHRPQGEYALALFRTVNCPVQTICKSLHILCYSKPNRCIKFCCRRAKRLPCQHFQRRARFFQSSHFGGPCFGWKNLRSTLKILSPKLLHPKIHATIG